MNVELAKRWRTRGLDASIFNQQKILEETSVLGRSLGERLETGAEEEIRHEQSSGGSVVFFVFAMCVVFV